MRKADDRIKLAEAMGWDRFYVGDITGNQYGCPTDSKSGELVPDPFTDANDDYAVLEWMRKYYEDLIDNDSWSRFSAHLYYFMHTNVTGYTIGDYARAALKVLE